MRINIGDSSTCMIIDIILANVHCDTHEQRSRNEKESEFRAGFCRLNSFVVRDGMVESFL